VPPQDMHWHQQQTAFWCILLLLFVAVIAALSRRTKPGSADAVESPEEVLKQRYARGEIDETTYDHMLEKLRR